MSVVNLKVLTDVDCNVFIDNELAATARKDTLAIIPLSEGDFWVEFIPLFNPECKIQKILSLEYHKVIHVNFLELFANNPELHRDEDLLYDLEADCYISNITGRQVNICRDIKSKVNIAVEYNAYVFKFGRQLYPCNYDHFCFKNDKILFGYNMKWHLIKRDGNEIISIYDTLYFADKDNVIQVYKNGLSGYVKKEDGVEVVPCIYETIWDHNDTDGYIAKKNGRWGLIDVEGKELTDFIYDDFDYEDETEIYGFRYGLVRFKLNDKWGVIDNRGVEIVSFVYDDLRRCGNNIIMVNIGKGYRKLGKWGLYNRNGLSLSPCIYNGFRYEKEHNLIIVDIIDEHSSKSNQQRKYGLFNENGEILPCVYESIKVTNKGLIIATIQKDGGFKRGLYNSKGLEIIPVGKYDITLLNDNTLQIYGNYNDKMTFGLYNEYGEEILPCIYDYKTYSALKESM